MRKLKGLFNFESNLLRTSLFIILIASLLIAKNFLWYQEDGSQSLNVIRGDGLGYYHYLPKLFIDHNLEYDEKNLHFIVEDGLNKYNKCFVGPSLFMVPFFTLGYACATFLEYNLDGYSFPFQLFISLGAIFYVVLGFFFLSKLLSKLNFSKRIRSSVLLLIFFGTNLLSAGILEPAMSHSYSFFSISVFLYVVYCFFSTRNANYLFAASIFFGLILLLRPTNGIVIFLIPYLFSRRKQSLKELLTLKNSLLAVIPTLFIISIQVLFWYLQTGDFFVLGYANEGFYFLEPKVWEVLFGFRKGWFIYTPIALFSFFGLIKVYQTNRLQFLSLLTFFLVLIYLTSSWWMWYYGPSFSMRPFVDFYAVIGVLLAYSMLLFKSKGRAIYIIVCLFCITLNLGQSYQYQKGIISSWDMNYEKYKAIFGVFERGQVTLGGNYDILPYNSKLESIFIKTFTFENNDSPSIVYDSASKSLVANYSNIEYNVSSTIQLGEKATFSKGNYFEIALWRYELQLNNSKKSQLIIEMQDSANFAYHHYWFHLNETPSKELEWKKCNYKILLPAAKNANDKLVFYIRNQEENDFYIDNLKLNLSAIN